MKTTVLNFGIQECRGRRRTECRIRPVPTIDPLRRRQVRLLWSLSSTDLSKLCPRVLLLFSAVLFLIEFRPFLDAMTDEQLGYLSMDLKC